MHNINTWFTIFTWTILTWLVTLLHPWFDLVRLEHRIRRLSFRLPVYSSTSTTPYRYGHVGQGDRNLDVILDQVKHKHCRLGSFIQSNLHRLPQSVLPLRSRIVWITWWRGTNYDIVHPYPDNTVITANLTKHLLVRLSFNASVLSLFSSISWKF